MTQLAPPPKQPAPPPPLSDLFVWSCLCLLSLQPGVPHSLSQKLRHPITFSPLLETPSILETTPPNQVRRKPFSGRPQHRLRGYTLKALPRQGSMDSGPQAE